MEEQKMINKGKLLFKVVTVIPKAWRKYVLALIAFLVYMTFFDSNNMLSQFNQNAKLKKAKAAKAYYIQEISDKKQKLEELNTDPLKNPEFIEKFAREQYLMKRDNEDIFVIVKDSISDKK